MKSGIFFVVLAVFLVKTDFLLENRYKKKVRIANLSALPLGLEPRTL